jgi:hypothetical protein
MWANRSICSYSDFNLAYVGEFQYKTGYATKKKPVGMETLNTHFLLTVYILYERTKFPSNIAISKYSAKITGITHKILTEACLSNPIMINHN